MPARSDLLPGTLDMLILKTLARGAQHGYGIAGRIRQVSDDVLQVEEGSLYPALHRLERKRLVESNWGASEANRKAKFYRLTARGRARLGVEATAWERMAAAIGQVMSARVEASE